MLKSREKKWIVRLSPVVALAVGLASLGFFSRGTTNSPEAGSTKQISSSDRDDTQELNALLRGLHEAAQNRDRFALRALFTTPESAMQAWGAISYQIEQVGHAGVVTATRPPTVRRELRDIRVDSLRLEAWYELARAGSPPNPLHTTWLFVDGEEGWRLGFLGLDASRIDYHDMMEELSALERNDRRRIRLGSNTSNAALLTSVLRAIEERNLDALTRISLNGVAAAAELAEVRLVHPRIHRKSAAAGLRAVQAQMDAIWEVCAELDVSPTQLRRALGVYGLDDLPYECRQITLSTALTGAVGRELLQLEAVWSAGCIENNWLLDAMELESTRSTVAR